MEITTLRTTCPDGAVCPSIHRIDTDSENLYVITKRVTDPAVLAAFDGMVGADEQLGVAPRTLLPEV